MFHKQLMLGMADFADVGLEVPDEDYKVPIGEADIKRQGSDVTIATVGLHVQRALKAAQQLREEGLDAEVLDLRTLVPLDEASVLDSVAKTNRLLVVDEDYQSFGLSGELIARVSEKQPESLDATARLTTPDAPVPYSPPLKDEVVPSVDDIAQGARDLIN